MDKREVFEEYNIEKTEIYYYNLETGATIDYNASKKERVDFMIKLMEDIAFNENVGEDINEEEFEKLEEKGKLKKLWGDNTYNFNAVIPTDVNYIVCEDDKGNFYAIIGIHSGTDIRTGYYNYYYKARSRNKILEDFIFSLINFNINLYIYFEDGGTYVADFEDDYYLIDSFINNKTEQAKRFHNEFEKEFYDVFF